MSDCIFCKIVKGEVPSAKVYEDEHSFAFLDIMPAVKGHTLVIPKTHYEAFLDIPKLKLQALISAVQKVTKAVVKSTGSAGYKIEMFNGEIAGQGVFHAHFHIIPRDKNDSIEFRADKNWWVQKKDLYKEGEKEEYAEKIKKRLEAV
ncbi:MAG: HIT family protein [Candidatus Nealsonbacteria bacterium]|nr:HIT family protein [Candidatus Nealsonbacteria bacterium]